MTLSEQRRDALTYCRTIFYNDPIAELMAEG